MKRSLNKLNIALLSAIAPLSVAGIATCSLVGCSCSNSKLKAAWLKEFKVREETRFNIFDTFEPDKVKLFKNGENIEISNIFNRTEISGNEIVRVTTLLPIRNNDEFYITLDSYELEERISNAETSGLEVKYEIELARTDVLGITIPSKVGSTKYEFNSYGYIVKQTEVKNNVTTEYTINYNADPSPIYEYTLPCRDNSFTAQVQLETAKTYTLNISTGDSTINRIYFIENDENYQVDNFAIYVDGEVEPLSGWGFNLLTKCYNGPEIGTNKSIKVVFEVGSNKSCTRISACKEE